MLHLEIVTPEKTIFSDTVQDVYLPGADGELGVLELHAALVTALAPGELRYKKDGQDHELAIGSGFAEVTQEKVSVLTDSAFGESEIDEEKAEAAIKRAEEALQNVDHSKDLEEVAHLQASIALNLAKLNLKRRKRQH
ncbi:ATP synthase epsilon chain [Rubritalea halochordaticola]|uniref:ATP synthase epsilon chain n=1 Tax=Rubritalea halochordaticola TaxID=714537 RepID=A0ABP9V7L3_9BACT